MSLRIAILGYKVELMEPWDPSTCGKGLPGSEEAVVYASEELVKQGHHVVIYMNPPVNTIYKINNPQWLHVDAYYQHDSRFDVVIMWRRFDVRVGRVRGNKVFMWSHDSPGNPKDYPFPNFDGIFLLSEYHRRQFQQTWINFDNIPYTISGNGLLLEHFPGNRVEKPNPYSIAYYSNYARGLTILLKIWPEIRLAYPQATLDILYGRETWGIMSTNSFNWTISRIEEYQTHGVRELGKVGHSVLAKHMQETSVWAYPCICPGETFCITAIKCQAAGMIPVTTRIAALNETIHDDAPGIDHIDNMTQIEEYKELLLNTLKRINEPEVIEERLKYINYGKKYTWKACVDSWLNFIKASQ